MNGQYEGFELYQTVAQEGESYPAAPAQPDILTQVQNAPTVWHVKKLNKVRFTTRSLPDVAGGGATGNCSASLSQNRYRQ